MTLRSRTAGPWLTTLFVVALTLAVAAAGAITWSLARSSPADSASAGWFAGSTAVAADRVAEDLTAAQLSEQLRQRARGVRASDPRSFLAGVAPSARPAQRAAFARLDPVPFRRYALRLVPGTHLSPDAWASGHLVVPVHVRLRLRFDPAVVRDTADASFRLADGRWRLLDVVPRHPEIWDIDEVDVVEGSRSLVLSDPVVMDAAALAGEVDAAVLAVRDTWPRAWPGRVVVVLPSSRADFERLAGVPAGGGVAGITSTRDATGPAAVRVQLDPRAFPDLVPLARQILLRHEITHAAQFAVDSRRVPAWLTEGTAEYIGYLGSGLPDAVVAGSVLADVRAGVVPRRLPADGAFGLAGGSADRRQSYEVSWAACRSIVDRYGRAALFRLYGALRSGPRNDGAVATALNRVLGLSPREFTAQWQTWLRSQA